MYVVLMAAPKFSLTDFWTRLEEPDSYYEHRLGLPRGRLRLFRHRGIPHKHRFPIFVELVADMGVTYEEFIEACDAAIKKAA